MDARRRLAETFLESHPEDAGRILERLPAEEPTALLGELSPRVAAAVVHRMAGASAAETLGRLPAAAAVLAELPLDAAATLLRRLDPALRVIILGEMPADVATPLGLVLRYPERTAGALMDPRVLALPADLSAGEALARIRRAPRHALYYVYIVHRTQVLAGVLNLRELMLAPAKVPLAAAMRPVVASIPPGADAQRILAHPGWRVYHALPVVTEGGVFLGAIRYETVRRLEGDAAATRPAAALDALLSMGELCWIGMAGLLADLVGGVAAGRTPGGASQGGDHGPGR